MPPVSAVHTSATTPRRTDLLKVSVTENVPGMTARATAFGFQIGGSATHTGTKPSRLSVSVDGHRVTVAVARGDTGLNVFRKLQQALPEGYQARILEQLRSQPPRVTIGISRKAGAVEDVSRIPTSIAANGASANVDPSFWINLMPGPGPRPNAIAAVAVTGTGFADAPPRFQVRSIDVYEQGTHRKIASVKSPRAQNSEVQWGQRTQTYRLEIPRSSFDPSKRFTFVVNTGINGSRPERVRSEYVPVGRVH